MEGLYDVSARVSAGVPPMWPHDGDVPLSARCGERATAVGFTAQMPTPLQFLMGLVCHHLPGLGRGNPMDLREQVTVKHMPGPRQRPCDLPTDIYTTERKAGEGALASSSRLCLSCAGQYEPNSEQNT